jgi:hypothetical protein
MGYYRLILIDFLIGFLFWGKLLFQEVFYW